MGTKEGDTVNVDRANASRVIHHDADLSQEWQVDDITTGDAACEQGSLPIHTALPSFPNSRVTATKTAA